MNVPTRQVKMLHKALTERGISAVMELPDGHKHVDIAIRDAKIYIEVDGLQHYLDPEQILADFKRSHYSNKNGFSTLHIPNQMIDTPFRKHC